MPFTIPNHTQTPNELFDMYLPLLSGSETKVLLIIIRQTIGWHRTRTRYSIGNIERATGLERNSVVKAAASLEEMGLIHRIPEAIPAEWELVWNTQLTPDPVPPQLLTPTPSIIDPVPPQLLTPTPSIIDPVPPQLLTPLKESKYRDKESKENPSPASTSQSINSFGDNHARKANSLYCAITGQICLPPDKQAEALGILEFILDYYSGNADLAASAGKPFFLAWCNTQGKSGKFYSKTNTAWLSKWLDGLAPNPGQVDVNPEAEAEQRAQEFMAKLLQQGRGR